MPALGLAPVTGSSGTGHLDPGLFMATSLTMQSGLTMRGVSAFGDMDLMAPFKLPIMAGVSVTSILVSTAFTRVVPDPFNGISTTGPLTFAAPIIPALTASISATSVLVTTPVRLPISSASLSQTLALFTAQTFIAPDQASGQAQAIYPLPFSAGTQLGLSPAASLSSMSALVAAATRVLPTSVASASDTEFVLLAPANLTGLSASVSDTEFLLASAIPFVPDPSASISDTEYAIPFVVLDLASASLSTTDVWLLAPGRVSVRKVRGAGARNVEPIGLVPLGS